ncbi:TetR/AcrR family transcriptional regulator [Nakamurella deserti]|uniref:TetR/AcrR family transcriptional regulator n=1 Tax=Nakamurella deserti TaxID=2164074 RepID=UPI00130067E4|nr:TetR family transcriptional regulator [Nakamurella deserti]
MAGRQTRNAERTRTELLEAATVVFSRQGPAASLDAVAAAAGTSKGGLLHHFPTRDQLLVALVEHQAERFRRRVEAELDPDDTAPGRLTRAFVRATFADIAEQHGRAHEQAMLLGTLGSSPHLLQIVAADARRWNERLREDGLEWQRLVLILRAADGTTIASLYEGALTREDADRTRDWLLELTHGTGPLR